MNIEELKEKLNKCKSLEFTDVDINDLEDINNINFSKKQSSNEKILDFIKSSNNPYMFKCNGKIVKIEFANNNISASNSLESSIKQIYQ